MVVAALECSLPGAQVGQDLHNLYFERYDFPDGSVFSTCSLVNVFGTYTGMPQFFRASDPASQQAQCYLRFETDARNALQEDWFFRVARGAASATLRLDAPGAPSDEQMISIPCVSR